MGARKLTQDIGRTCSKRIAKICNNGGTFHNNTFSHDIVLSPMKYAEERKNNFRFKCDMCQFERNI